jgi:proline dehydrogenase
VLALAQHAKAYDIGINIDAEEADRLELSLDLLESALPSSPELAGWNGIGFVMQAYQKRCPFVIDYVIDLAQRSRHRMMIRLVKGAYWDSEIKRAQVDGQRVTRSTRASPTPTSPTSPAPGNCWRHRRRVSAVRHPQRTDAGVHLWRWRATVSTRPI